MMHKRPNTIDRACDSNLPWTLPARMDAKLTADILGFQEHDITVLVTLGQLEPLGKPVPNARKYFARVLVLELGDNPAWLSKATKLVAQHWQTKNASRKQNAPVVESSHAE